jgi:hypothetical protein
MSPPRPVLSASASMHSRALPASPQHATLGLPFWSTPPASTRWPSVINCYRYAAAGHHRCPRHAPSRQGTQHGIACHLPRMRLCGIEPLHRMRVGRLRRCHLPQLLHPMAVSVQHLARTSVSGQDMQRHVWATQSLCC